MSHDELRNPDRPAGLPENAYRKLEEGEVYHPVVPADRPLPEVTAYSLFWGMFYAVLFSMAAAYLGLKIGQVFEAAIPIAILAVGFSVMTGRRNALSENVIIQSIGASSGLIVAGAIFTIPGLYILGLEATFMQVFLASLLGGFLGILFLIPFRKYFVADMHGEFPFPEATATTEVLVAGESGGNQARILVKALFIGGLYDFMVSGLGFWKEIVSTRAFAWGRKLADSVKLEFNVNIGAAVTGLGYIIGLKYSLIIACGSFLSWWVLVPAIYYIGQFNPAPILSAAKPISDMLPIEIFSEYVRHIGIGGIAAAGIIGIIKSRRIISGAFRLAAREITGKGVEHGAERPERLQRDMSMKWNVILIFASLIGVFAFFLLGVVGGNWYHALVGLAIVTIISFLFTTVSARAIAIVGTNPVSGMTLMTLIIASVILVSVGLKGEQGMLAALLIGGVVCTALAMAGGFITDLKIGYWLGTTPVTQQRYKFLGTLLSAAAVGLVILMLYKTYGFGPGGLEAPQASAMAAVLKPLMTGQPAPWLLYLAGIMLAVVLEFIGVPPLAFALGMYLPLYLNTPLLAGGLIAHFVSRSSAEKKLQSARKERGTLIASGFIAGGAIMGVVAAAIIYFGQLIFGEGWSMIRALGTDHWQESFGGEALGFVMFVLLLGYLYWDSRRARVE
ncbi:MAG: oligopeptide transporter, OPT family [Acidobacteriota bacterium]|jgi:putative OPT family oligopeptide transporter|nr:oligopeptide transporter, OPT family [Acidobacteriota bacterium]